MSNDPFCFSLLALHKMCWGCCGMRNVSTHFLISQVALPLQFSSRNCFILGRAAQRSCRPPFVICGLLLPINCNLPFFCDGNSHEDPGPSSRNSAQPATPDPNLSKCLSFHNALFNYTFWHEWLGWNSHISCSKWLNLKWFRALVSGTSSTLSPDILFKKLSGLAR